MPQTKSECTDAIFTFTSAPIESLASRERPCTSMYNGIIIPFDGAHRTQILVPVYFPTAGDGAGSVHPQTLERPRYSVFWDGGSW